MRVAEPPRQLAEGILREFVTTVEAFQCTRGDSFDLIGERRSSISSISWKMTSISLVVLDRSLGLAVRGIDIVHVNNELEISAGMTAPKNAYLR